MLNKAAQKHRLVAILICAAAAAPLAADPPGAIASQESAGAGRIFRDWRLLCAGADCRLATEVRSADGGLILRLEMLSAAGLVRVATPLPLFLPDGVSVTFGETPAVTIPWRTCAAGECVAEVELSPDLHAALRRERTATLGLTLAEGLQVRLAVSLLGFSAAERALSAP